MDSSETTEPNSVLQRIAAGDSGAVDDCLKQYGGLVWSLANRYCRVSGDAEDAAQEIFVALWRNADRFDPTKAAESTFVTMIARRRLIDRNRRKGSKPEVVSISAAEIEMADRDPIDQVELSDEAAKAARCMRHLSKNQRQILTRSIDRGEAQSAIATALNMPLGTVKSYARRGILQLRECMKRPLSPEAAS
ncbi:ECF RNA polymerase sigma factor SigK [Stieleria neptunia]|uniref:ECF RNA polymerase sigma factor SigK n=1 Tax=Stieleria neptunia TaxID=2527979 RepID=A0A518HQA2_9BACT|nr:sigma-70 family RNA polymerase sigma factor [Stieleria neptunia]QDV43025.1 ECF RNA polymerase sigma factor SigK [Stieleria neptunia]